MSDLATILLVGIQRPDLSSCLERRGFSVLSAASIGAVESVERPYEITLVDSSIIDTTEIERLYFLNQATPVCICSPNPAALPSNLSALCCNGTLACLYYDEIASGALIGRIERELLFHRLNRVMSQAQADNVEKMRLKRDLALHSRVADHERELNANIIASIGSGMVILDPTGMIMLMNEPARQLLFSRSGEAVGMHFKTVFSLEMRMAVEKVLDRMSDGKSARPVERVMLKDTYLQVSGYPIINRGRGPAGSIILIQDITEQEAMALQLYRSEKLATIGAMLSGISHELRNPLAIISARCQRLRAKENLQPDQLAKGLESIDAQASRCANIIAHLLDFTRQTAIAPAYHAIAGILDETLGYLDYQNIFDNIVIEKKYGANLEVFGDRPRLVQAFLNIIANAADAMNGKGVLTIETKADGPDFVRVDVNDTGVGIPPEILKKIFDPFYTTKDPGKGTGLGLAIVQKIVQESGGAVWAESSFGNTTFFVKLPSLKERIHDSTHPGC